MKPTIEEAIATTRLGSPYPPVFSLEQIGEARTKLEAGGVQGKVVVAIGAGGDDGDLPAGTG